MISEKYSYKSSWFVKQREIEFMQTGKKILDHIY